MIDLYHFSSLQGKIPVEMICNYKVWRFIITFWLNFSSQLLVVQVGRQFWRGAEKEGRMSYSVGGDSPLSSVLPGQQQQYVSASPGALLLAPIPDGVIGLVRDGGVPQNNVPLPEAIVQVWIHWTIISSYSNTFNVINTYIFRYLFIYL